MNVSHGLRIHTAFAVLMMLLLCLLLLRSFSITLSKYGTVSIKARVCLVGHANTCTCTNTLTISFSFSTVCASHSYQDACGSVAWGWMHYIHIQCIYIIHSRLYDLIRASITYKARVSMYTNQRDVNSSAKKNDKKINAIYL